MIGPVKDRHEARWSKNKGGGEVVLVGVDTNTRCRRSRKGGRGG